MKTPKTETVTLAANQEKTVPLHGTHLHVRSCSVGRFEAAFDDDPLQPFYPGGTYPADGKFKSIRLKDSLGGGCTIIIIVAEAEFTGVYDAAVLSAIEGVLTGMATDIADVETLLGSIDTTQTGIAADIASLELLQGIPDVPTAVPETTIAKTGIGENHLITAAAVNRRVLVQADYDNGGEIYVGFATGVTEANTPVHLQPGDSWPEDFAGDVYACSQNGIEKARAYVIAIT